MGWDSTAYRILVKKFFCESLSRNTEGVERITLEMLAILV